MSPYVVGAIIGFAMGLLTNYLTVWLLYALVREGRMGWFESAGWGSALAAVVVGTGSIVWICAGALAAILFEVLGGDGGKSGLGSPNMVYTIIVVGFAWLPLPPLYMLLRRYWWYYGSLALLFAVLFGWAFPHMAYSA